MNKKLQVFVSSTFTDLIEERQAAVEAILDAGHIPAGMELFKAGKSQMKTICKWIDESDVYMLILGGRYGTIENESDLSYTELEYRYALSKKMPIFTIVLNDNFLRIKIKSKGENAILEKENIDKYNSFKEFVKTAIVKFVSNIHQIPSVVHSHLNFIANDEELTLTGWIRQYNNTSTELIRLINENKSLKEQLQKAKNNPIHFEHSIQNETNKTKQEYLKLLSKYPQEAPYNILENILSSTSIIYKDTTYTALDFFKMQYINKHDSTCTIKKQNSDTFMQDTNFNGVFLFFEKCDLVIRVKHDLFNLYIFYLSQRGEEFCKYLCSK